MARVIVFGLRDFASLAHYYLKHDSGHDVVAFTVTRDFLPSEPNFEDKPVVPFEELETIYSPDEFCLLAPLSPRGMNRLREQVFLEAKARGYRFISYVSSRATIFPGVGVGENCFILEDNTIQPFVRIGDNVVLWSGNHIGHHSVIEDHVMITSHVVISGHCIVESYVYIGINSSIRDGVRLGEGTLVGMQTCVQRDTEPWSVYQGNPARKREMASTDVEL